MKKCVSLSLDSDVWVRFQGVAGLSGITPSSIVESIFRAFLSHMRAGDDLHLELANMISSYTENKDLDSEIEYPLLSDKSSSREKKLSPKKERKKKVS